MFWMLPLATAAFGVFQADQQSAQAAEQARVELATRQMNIEWGNHQRKLEGAARNREEAKQNAGIWFNNWMATTQIKEAEAEAKLYHRYNVENEIGNFSNQHSQGWDNLNAMLEGSNTDNSQTANQKIHVFREQQKDTLVAQNLVQENRERDITRGADAQMNQLNFSYNKYTKVFSTPSEHIDPDAAASRIRNNVLTTGLMNTGLQTLGATASAIQGYEAEQRQTAQTELFQKQLSELNEMSDGDLWRKMLMQRYLGGGK